MNEIRVQGSKYSDEDRRMAVVEVYVKGNAAAAGRSLNIPQRTICDWMASEWWQVVSAEVRSEINERILEANLAIAQRAQEAILERIEGGDYRAGRDGELTRVPVSARDLSIVGGIAQDKARVQQSMPTSISGNVGNDAIRALAEQFEELSRRHNEKVVESD